MVLRILLIDGHTLSRNGRKRMERFRRGVYDVMMGFQTPEDNIEFVELTMPELLTFMEHIRTDSKIVHEFDTIDFVMIECDDRLVPWHPRAADLLRFIRFVVLGNKFLMTFGCATVMLGYVCRSLRSHTPESFSTRISPRRALGWINTMVSRDTGCVYKYNRSDRRFRQQMALGVKHNSTLRRQSGHNESSAYFGDLSTESVRVVFKGHPVFVNPRTNERVREYRARRLHCKWVLQTTQEPFCEVLAQTDHVAHAIMTHGHHGFGIMSAAINVPQFIINFVHTKLQLRRNTKGRISALLSRDAHLAEVLLRDGLRETPVLSYPVSAGVLTSSASREDMEANSNQIIEQVMEIMGRWTKKQIMQCDTRPKLSPTIDQNDTRNTSAFGYARRVNMRRPRATRSSETLRRVNHGVRRKHEEHETKMEHRIMSTLPSMLLRHNHTLSESRMQARKAKWGRSSIGGGSGGACRRHRRGDDRDDESSYDDNDLPDSQWAIRQSALNEDELRAKYPHLKLQGMKSKPYTTPAQERLCRVRPRLFDWHQPNKS